MVTCGRGGNALVIMTDCFVVCSLVTSSLVAPGACVLACHRPWLKSSLLKMEGTFGLFSERILRHSKTCNPMGALGVFSSLLHGTAFSMDGLTH